MIVEPLPRMADPTRWVTAAEPAFGWAAGSFAAAYARNRADSLATTRDDAAIAAPLIALAETGPWSGTATELLARLYGLAPASVRADPDWPRTPRKLTAELTRLAPALREAGLDWRRPRRTGSARLHTISRAGSAAMTPDPLTHPAGSGTTVLSEAGVADDGSSSGAEGSTSPASNRHPRSGTK